MKLRRASTNALLTFDESADQLHQGGEGRIFRVPGDASLVAKVYDDPKPRRAKIEAMIKNPPSDNATANHVSIAWPLDALYASNDPKAFVGYLMKRIEKCGTIFGVMHPERRKQERPHFTFWHLLVVGSNVASAFRALHSKGYIVGDINELNVLVTDRGLVTLVDTDSFQVPKPGGRGVFRCTVGHDEFWPPELEGQNYGSVDRSVEHDLFGLGVLIFQLLMQSVHPFHGIVAGDDWPIRKRITKGNFPFGSKRHPIKPTPFDPSLDMFPSELKDLILRCFESGHTNPSARPTAVEWKHALDHAADHVKPCSRNKQHVFANHLKQCTWCELADRAKVDFFPPPGGSQIARSSGQRRLPVKSSTFKPAPKVASSASTPPPSSSSSLASSASNVPASSSSTTSSSTTPTLGGFFTSLLTEVGKRLVQGALDGGSNGGGTYSAPIAQPEIHAGRWQFQLTSPIHPMASGPILVGSLVLFHPSGGFQGQGQLYMMGGTRPCGLVGQWRYDSNYRVLLLQGMVNGMPPLVQRTLRITGGMNGRYTALDDEGFQCLIQRV